VYYRFKWIDQNGDEWNSIFPVYDDSSDYVDVIENIKQNAMNMTQ
jgi:hypothetical protein